MRNNRQIKTGQWISVCLLLFIGLTLLSCSDEKTATGGKVSQAVAPQAKAPQNIAATTAKGPSMTQVSNKGLFQLNLQSDEAPLPLNRFHNWTVRIATPDGRLVDDATVMVYGGMPAHKHGFPSNPRVTENLGNGRYRIEGVKFNMPGRWEMWLNVRAMGKDDKVIFSFDVP